MGKTIANTEASEAVKTAAKIGKTAVGVQGLQDRSAAKHIQEICGEYYDAAEAVTENKRQELNYAITDFGEYRLRALHQTVGRFLQYLKELKQNNATKEYEILFGADIDTKTLDKMERIDMAASAALRSTAITGTFGAVAVLGTPAAVTGAVGALATASTGTAISSLSGAAANSAILAWLGGGSLAAGGGGMAVGAVMTYLDKSFDERRENFQKLFSVVDDALEKDNMQELAMSLEGIIKLAESSPFKDLQTIEATAAALTDPDHEWDF
jgi:hypothetical protein